MVTKEPFQDARGEWWVYRSDDPKMHSPLGPFFTSEYASNTELTARKTKAPMPTSLSHRQPVRPLRVPRG